MTPRGVRAAGTSCRAAHSGSTRPPVRTRRRSVVAGAIARAPPRRQTVRVVARLVVFGLVVVLHAGCGAQQRDEPEPPRITNGDIVAGDLIDIGGRSLYLECSGSGSPTLVLEAGFGGSTDNWRTVLPRLGEITRTCAYDRAGLGQSDPMPGVHDAGDEIKDLEALLKRARVEPPYVLVGHSYGGLLARLYARAHERETGGVVLIDAVGRDDWRRGFAAWPKSLAPKLRRAWAKPVVDGVDRRAAAALASSIRSMDDLPLIVVSAARERENFTDLPPRLYRIATRLWTVMQTELAGLSSDAVHVVALGSDHFVQDDQPDVVIRAVRTVVRSVRDRVPLPPCEQVLAGPGVRCLN
jgi:pimeloyl-ACP methyl ester carboxylesterase